MGSRKSEATGHREHATHRQLSPSFPNATTGCLQSFKHEERKMQQQPVEFIIEKTDKKERQSKSKDKREKVTDEEKELRRERKMVRKRVMLFEKSLD